MKLVTNIAIDYPTGITSMGNAIVTGELGTKGFMEDMSIHVNFTYSVEAGDFRDGSGVFTLPKEDVQAMYDAVSSGLPDPNVDYVSYIETTFYKAFVNEMVATFSGLTSASQVDIVE